jgi:hypothetical protein
MEADGHLHGGRIEELERLAACSKRASLSIFYNSSFE